MPVALGMGDADQGAERKILLHAEAGLTGQVLARYEESFVSPAPLRRACCIDDRLVDSLAGFGRDAAVAERTRRRKSIVGIVGFVDDKIATSECAERRFSEDVA